MRIIFIIMAILLASCASQSPVTSSTNQAEPIPIKFVVVTMFEIGEDEGDHPGEFQLWKERLSLTTRIPFHAHHDLFLNEEMGVLGMVTGIGTAKSTASIMALGMDPRFDLSKAYWLVAGISGIDPEDASIGSAAWAEYLIDGDLAHEIDAREKPDDWETGYFARYTKKPFDPNKPEPTGEMWQLKLDFVDWAYELTKDIVLPDFESLTETRDLYINHPNAQKKPFVLKGDQLAAMTFWHGEIMNEWANKWVDYWTDGKGEFVTSAMEDTGTYQSLFYLDKINKVDVERLLVLRTGSNYTMQSPDKTAAENLLLENEEYAGLLASLESAYIVGNTVIQEILNNWDKYENQIPSSNP